MATSEQFPSDGGERYRRNRAAGVVDQAKHLRRHPEENDALAKAAEDLFADTYGLPRSDNRGPREAEFVVNGYRIDVKWSEYQTASLIHYIKSPTRSDIYVLIVGLPPYMRIVGWATGQDLHNSIRELKPGVPTYVLYQNELDKDVDGMMDRLRGRTAVQPAFEDDWLTIYGGDAREVLRGLPEKSVHMAVTSPPYWGLRAYGTDPQVWGGDPGHEHVWGTPEVKKGGSQKQGATSQRAGRSNIEEQRMSGRSAGSRCSCGAWLGELGMEPTPSLYVDHLVEVFQAVRRVLRDDGLFFLNIGDTYAAERGATPMPAETIAGGVGGHGDEDARRGRGNGVQPHRKASAYGLKHKDLVLIPARLALALQEDGWWVRNDIIWSTPNPMPESVTDRFTSSYEHVFMLAKSDRYYFDQDAVREPHTDVTLNRIKYGLHQKHPDGIGVAIPPVNTDVMGDRFANPNGRNRRDVWTIPTVPYKGAHFAVFPPKLVEPMVLAATSERGVCPECGAPWRRVTERIREARGDAFGRKDIGEFDHGQAGRPYTEVVAVETIGWMPTCEHDIANDLRECPECGEPYREIDAVDPWLRFVNPGRAQSVRAVELAQEKGLTLEHIEALRAAGITDTGKAQQTQTGWLNNTEEVQRLATEAKLALGAYVREFTFLPSRTVGWEPTCQHEVRQTVPAVVLDPFAGSGTVGKVAQDHNRRAVLIDLNPEYLGQQLSRNAQMPLGLGIE